MTDTNNSTIQYEYDKVGQLTRVFNGANYSMEYDYDAEGRVTQWQYDGNGNITKVVDSLGNLLIIYVV